MFINVNYIHYFQGVIMKKSTLLLTCVLSALNCSWALADTGASTMPTFQLDGIVVIGEATQANTDKNDVNMEEKIDAGQLHTAADILQNVPGIVVNRGQNSGIQVGMRGLNHERTVIAINGNVVENIGEIMQGRALEWDALPITDVKSIKVLRGAKTAKYGGAVAGVINIITDDKATTNSTKIRSSYGSWNTKKTTLLHQSHSEDNKWGLGLTLSQKKSDGYYRNNDMHGHDGNLNLTYHISEDKKLSLLYSHVYKKEGMIVGNNNGKNPASKYLGFDSGYPTTPNLPALQVDGYRQWTTDNISLNYTTDKTNISLYDYRQNRLDHAQAIKQPNKLQPMKVIWDASIRNYGANWDQTTQVGKHELTYGLQHKVMKFNIKNENAHYRLPGNAAFIEDNWSLNDNTVIGLGLRYDSQKFEATNGAIASAKHSQLTPRVSVTHRLSDKSTVYGGISKLFRTPTVADYSRWSSTYIDKDGDYRKAFKPGSSLEEWQAFLGIPQPEKGMSYELGFSHELNEKTNLRVTGFYYDIDDYLNISFGPKGNLRPPAIYNIDNVKVKGLELMGDHKVNKNLSLVSGYTYQKSKKTGDKLHTALRNLPTSTFNFGVHYSNLNGFRANLDMRYKGEVKSENASSRVAPNAITDLTLSYAREAHQFTLAINNIFDKYYEESHDFRMPGINYSFSYQYSF